MNFDSPVVSPVVISATAPVVTAITGFGAGEGPYAVLGFAPPFVSDFIEEYYRTNDMRTTFSDAVTHSRSGNATMVDGYGPELVTNGTFDSGLSGWTVEDGTASVNDGRLFVTAGAGGFVYVSQSFATKVGVRYILTLNLDTVTSTHNYVALGTTSNNLAYSYVNVGTGKQSYEVTFTATETTSVIKFSTGIGSGLSSFWDNVSVREMPVLKWAPHNFVTYSEQFDNAAWTKTRASITADATASPDGTTTADLLVEDSTASNTHELRTTSFTFVSGAGYTLSVYAKAPSSNARNISLRLGTSQTDQAYFDVVNGSVLSAGADATATILAVGNGWYRCSVSSNNIAAGSAQSNIFLIDGTASITYTGDGTSGVYIWGAHLYRSDLGGMVDNPDRGDSYVPTTSAAVYLPRRGHHVYNGSAWVNEGLLHESELRVNAQENSNVFTGSGNVTITADQAVSPDGTTNASLYDENAASPPNAGLFGVATVTAGVAYTSSVFVKYKSGSGWVALCHRGSSASNQFFAWFDIQNGVVGSNQSGSGSMSYDNHGIEDCGNGWYRIYTVGTDSGSTTYNIFVISAPSDSSTSRETDAEFYVYGAQLEAGSTPSSYIPTAGASVTRAAETLTIPSAKLPWPTPQVIGPELVTNGTFDTDSDWTKGTGWSISGGKLVGTSVTSFSEALQSLSIIDGNVYLLSFDAVVTSGSFKVNLGSLGYSLAEIAVASTGSYSKVIRGTSTNQVTFWSNASFTGTVDNVSVREINPLSVSIQMDGRMTYVDDDGSPVTFFRWYFDGNNLIQDVIDAQSTRDGHFMAVQEFNSTQDYVREDAYDPGILVPFNVASRHGSTFINGAADGVAFTANTTPTGLPNLSSTDLNLGFIYMGTIARFRVWDVDLGDTGIEAATAPSLEPSLSLTFDSTEGSFTVDDWRA